MCLLAQHISKEQYLYQNIHTPAFELLPSGKLWHLGGEMAIPAPRTRATLQYTDQGILQQHNMLVPFADLAAPRQSGRVGLTYQGSMLAKNKNPYAAALPLC